MLGRYIFTAGWLAWLIIISMYTRREYLNLGMLMVNGLQIYKALYWSTDHSKQITIRVTFNHKLTLTQQLGVQNLSPSPFEVAGNWTSDPTSVTLVAVILRRASLADDGWNPHQLKQTDSAFWPMYVHWAVQSPVIFLPLTIACVRSCRLKYPLPNCWDLEIPSTFRTGNKTIKYIQEKNRQKAWSPDIWTILEYVAVLYILCLLFYY